MQRHKIKYELACVNLTLKDIADDLDVTVSMVSHVLARRYRSLRIEQAIAQAINKPIEKVFPGYKFPKK